MQYSESTIYGFNLILKDYARFPRFLPLYCHLEHGWTARAETLPTELEADKPLMLVHSKRRLEAWKKSSKIPVYIMGSPFIHYREMHKILKRTDAKGTIVFPAHSTADIKSSFDVKKYCGQLQKLPKQFHPIEICLFWPDFIDESANIYRECGFRVTTAGPKFKKGLNFIENFYKILSTHQYATSNEVGSYTFYAINLGIPFFLTGEIPLRINTGSNKDMGSNAKINQEFYGKRAINMFSTGPISKITSSQARLVSSEMGLNDCLSRAQMHKLFWDNFKKDKRRFLGVLTYWIISILLFLGLVNWAVLLRETFRNLFKHPGKTA